ncbi:MAG: aminopeptidase P family protein [Rhodospirillaceae bacterium]
MIKKQIYLERLAALRASISKLGVDGFLVPLADEYQSEDPPKSARRLEWLTGFQGSAGIAAVLQDRAAIFVDGRYTVQVRNQVDTDTFETHHQSLRPLSAWLSENSAGSRIGFDPWVHSVEGYSRLEKDLAKGGISLVPLDQNPIDIVWQERPSPPNNAVIAYDEVMAGQNSNAKRAEIAEVLKRERADAAIINAPDSVAWLLNIRGSDLLHTPVALSRIIIGNDSKVTWFVNPKRVSETVLAHIGPDVSVVHPDTFLSEVQSLGQAGSAVLVTSGSTPFKIIQALQSLGAKVLDRPDPVALPKACKNSAEIRGIRAAHIRDGASLSKFLAWLSRSAPSGEIDELTAAKKLYQFRAENEKFHGLSFETISGSGPNGAIVHYRADENTNRQLEPGTLYLVDSGAQYLDGTTDVTRTIAIGTPTGEMRDRFTRVLKGHIGIATAQFPLGTCGAALDSFARRSLWDVGLDFDHGTGHGVGCYLGVHEGPHRIAKRGANVPLQHGMIVSNEPGFYKEGCFGIRIENLELVRALPSRGREETQFLGFEALTLAPIDRSLVDFRMLNNKELDWWNNYHHRVLVTLGSLVDRDTADWLEQVCCPVKVQVH